MYEPSGGSAPDIAGLLGPAERSVERKLLQVLGLFHAPMAHVSESTLQTLVPELDAKMVGCAPKILPKSSPRTGQDVGGDG